MDEIYYDGWLEDDGTYTNENGVPFWDLERQEEELRAWEERDEED
jgi:hypothetical protein